MKNVFLNILDNSMPLKMFVVKEYIKYQHSTHNKINNYR